MIGNMLRYAALGLLFAVWLSVQSFLPWHPLVITSASMGTDVPVGSLTYIDPGDNWVPGDVVAFHVIDAAGHRSIYVHRLLYVDKQTGNIATKGDANPRPDVWPHPISQMAIIGRVPLTIPRLGYLDVRLHTLQGLVAFLILAAELLFLPSVLRWAAAPAPVTALSGA